MGNSPAEIVLPMMMMMMMMMTMMTMMTMTMMTMMTMRMKSWRKGGKDLKASLAAS